MQTVNFKTVNDFLSYLTEDEFEIVQKLREIIINTIPDYKEKLAYNVPYYYRNSSICFIWPGSIGWGKKTYSGVRLGFTKAYLFANATKYLSKENRKQVYWKDYFDKSQVEKDIEIIQSLLYEAINIDNHYGKSRKM